MRQRIKSFLRQEGGASTVETVLWLPLLVAVFGFMLDLAMIFNGQAKVLRVIQDANREYSVGKISDPATRIKNELNGLEIWPSKITPTVTAGVIRTTVVIPTRQLTITHFFGAFADLEVDVTADMMIENWEV